MYRRPNCMTCFLFLTRTNHLVGTIPRLGENGLLRDCNHLLLRLFRLGFMTPPGLRSLNHLQSRQTVHYVKSHPKKQKFSLRVHSHKADFPHTICSVFRNLSRFYCGFYCGLFPDTNKNPKKGAAPSRSGMSIGKFFILLYQTNKYRSN